MENLSICGNIWNIAKTDEASVQRMSEMYDIPDYLAHMLILRKISINEVNNFMHPKIQNLMPDPYVLKDMQKGVERIKNAVINNEKIGIIGDYDVDGATSTSILTLFFRQVGINPIIHIPSREEGYGPSDMAFAEFEKNDIHAVITIDCGTTAFDVLNNATNKGFDIIVIDHHEAEVILPKVFAIINPKRLDEENDYPYLQYMSAVGVGFMFLVGLNRALRESGFYEKITPPDLMNLLDLVALGTVCDVVPLLGLNRAYVIQGLKIMAKQKNIGIKNLLKVLQINSAPSTYHLGYGLGPRINACGRVGDASLGSKLLCCQNEEIAQKLAESFDNLNNERKEIENYVLLQAIEQIEKNRQEAPMTFVYGTDWHQGVIGIVAGRLKERYNVPSFVMSIEADEVKGSARSVSGIDLGSLIIAAKEKGIITGGGGHTMAAGFSLNIDKIPEFKEFVGEYITKYMGKEKNTPIIDVDYAVSLTGINEKFAEDINMLEPFGTDNPEPIIMIKNVAINNPQIVGSGHVKCYLSSSLGGYLPAICFRCTDNELGNALLNHKGEIYNIIGNVKLDVWQGRKKIQFVINDIARIE